MLKQMKVSKQNTVQNTNLQTMSVCFSQTHNVIIILIV